MGTIGHYVGHLLATYWALIGHLLGTIWRFMGLTIGWARVGTIGHWPKEHQEAKDHHVYLYVVTMSTTYWALIGHLLGTIWRFMGLLGGL